MGVVWKARQISLNRLVALKLLLNGQFANESAIKRFEFEAEAAANLDHPHIVPILTVGSHEGWPYLAMKLMEGSSLAGCMAEFVLPNAASRGTSEGCSFSKSQMRGRQSKIADLLAKVARAVHFAHQRGILHRDLKPPNILIDGKGQPHVTDFGLAKRVASDGNLTITGAILGSPFYMAPEQAVGNSRQLSTAVDTYSLGVILYELLTGRLPFKAETPVGTLRLVLETEPARPRSINHVVNRDLETICLKCLEKDPNHRYPSAEALAEDLDLWQATRPIKARRSNAAERAIKWIRREPLKASLLGVILLALLGPYLVERSFLREYSHMATEHPVTTPDRNGVYSLPLYGHYKEDRCTDNFWRGPFEKADRRVKLEFINVPSDLVATLHCLIRADQVGRPDPARTPILTNGQIFHLMAESPLDRDFYIASVGWQASNILAQASNATIKLVLLQ